MTLDLFDIAYIVGLAVVWYGNIRQIEKVVKTKSTKSISLHWIVAIFLSIMVRLPRAVTSDYWAWSVGYVISFLVCAVLVGTVIYYRKKYPKK